MTHTFTTNIKCRPCLLTYRLDSGPWVPGMTHSATVHTVLARIEGAKTRLPKKSYAYPDTQKVRGLSDHLLKLPGTTPWDGLCRPDPPNPKSHHPESPDRVPWPERKRGERVKVGPIHSGNRPVRMDYGLNQPGLRLDSSCHTSSICRLVVSGIGWLFISGWTSEERNASHEPPVKEFDLPRCFKIFRNRLNLVQVIRCYTHLTGSRLKAITSGTWSSMQRSS